MDRSQNMVKIDEIMAVDPGILEVSDKINFKFVAVIFSC